VFCAWRFVGAVRNPHRNKGRRWPLRLTLTATFDAGRLSSDGGLVVLRQVERRLGLAKTMTAPLADDRDPTRVLYSYADMARARMLRQATRTASTWKSSRPIPP
jgi:hypothetical protein